MQIIVKILAFTSGYNTLIQTFNRLISATVTSKKKPILCKKKPILCLKAPPAFPGHTTKNETLYLCKS